MNKKIIGLSLLTSVILLSGCGKQAEPEQVSELTPFYLTTQGLYSTENLGVISKTATVEGSSDVVLTAQTAGRISSLPIKIGDRIGQGNLLVQLADTTNISANVQNAELAVQRAQLGKRIAQEDIAQQRRKLDYDIRNVDNTIEGSNSQIQLEKLEQDLAKLELDFSNRLIADEQQSVNFINTTKNIQSDLRILLIDLIDETDKVLGITEQYQNDTKYVDMRTFIGAKSVALKNDGIASFLTLQNTQRQLLELNNNELTVDNLVDILITLQELVRSISDHLVIMREVFINSIDDTRYQAQINAFSAVFVGLQNRSSAINTAVTNQINASRTYFATYQNNQTSLVAQIDSLRLQIDLAKKQLQDAQFNTQISVERSEIAFDNQSTNADFTLQQAQIQLAQARTLVSKLRVTAPLDVTVADVMVDIGQDVTPGTPLVRIVSNQQQIQITATPAEIQNMKIGQSVIVESTVGAAEGTITSISTVADRSGGFPVVIAIKNSTIPTGLSVVVKIPVQSGALTLPINALRIVDTNKAVAQFWDTVQQKIVMETVTIGSFFGDYVQIDDVLSTDYELIMNDISKFDADTMKIEIIEKN